MKKDIRFLHSKKQSGQQITMLTAYDHPTAVLQEQAGIDVIFVGDSVGTNVLGYQSETEVTMADMIHHLKAVRRGVTDACLLVDMPYKSYETPAQALENAEKFHACGVDGVKVEGWAEAVEIVRALTEEDIDVCAHIGHNPQIHGTKGRTHGKTVSTAKKLIQSALALESAGAVMVVLEKIPEEISRIITTKLRIPTIGIGAGRFCDGQVLVINDILGLGPNLIHAKKYQDFKKLTFQAICQYKEEVENGQFPTEDHAAHLDAEKLARVESWLENLTRASRQK